jgi:hypothetical protein
MYWIYQIYIFSNYSLPNEMRIKNPISVIYDNDKHIQSSPDYRHVDLSSYHGDDGDKTNIHTEDFGQKFDSSQVRVLWVPISLSKILMIIYFTVVRIRLSCHNASNEDKCSKCVDWNSAYGFDLYVTCLTDCKLFDKWLMTMPPAKPPPLDHQKTRAKSEWSSGTAVWVTMRWRN